MSEQNERRQQNTQEILMFEERASEKSVNLKSQKHQNKIESGSQLVDHDSHIVITSDYALKNQDKSIKSSRSQDKNTEQTDEKLFLESTGFGQPKHFTQDYELPEDDKQDDTGSQQNQTQLVNIAVPTATLDMERSGSQLSNPQNSKTATNDNEKNTQGGRETNAQMKPFFSKRQNSVPQQLPKPSSEQAEHRYSNSLQAFNPSASVGFPMAQMAPNAMTLNDQQRQQNRTLTTLVPLANNKINLKNKKFQDPSRARYQSNLRGSTNKFNQPLPSLNLKSRQVAAENTGLNFKMGAPTTITPAKIARKHLQQKLQIRQAYSRSNMTAYIEKGAFGGALQEIVADQEDQQVQTHQNQESRGASPDLLITIDQKDTTEKKARRKQRLNQIIHAASKGARTVKPSIEIEEIAHQYHNLRREFNQVKEENNRMKTRLTKMQASAATSENQMVSLNQELLRFKHEQRMSNPMQAIEQMRHPETENGDGTTPNMLTQQSQHMSSTPTLSKNDSRDRLTLKFEQSNLVMSLKKQIADQRKKNEEQEQEIEDLKKSTKVCVFNELDVQLEAYTDECSRLRSLMEQELAKQSESENQIKELKKLLEEKEKAREEQQIAEEAEKEAQKEAEKEAELEAEAGKDLEDVLLKPEDFEISELESLLAQVTAWQNDEASLNVEVAKLFIEFDSNEDDSIDRRELRHFLTSLFEMFHIKSPINDDYVDYVFRQIDMDHDNSINLVEMQQYAKVFNNRLVDQAQKALEELKSGSQDDQQQSAVTASELVADDDKEGEQAKKEKDHSQDEEDDKADNEKVGKQGPKNEPVPAHQILGISKLPFTKPSQQLSQRKTIQKEKSRNASKSRQNSMQKRVHALNDNVRSKNLQITELNRQLKATNENFIKQQKLASKKQRDLEKANKALEKELAEYKEKDQNKEIEVVEQAIEKPKTAAGNKRETKQAVAKNKALARQSRNHTKTAGSQKTKINQAAKTTAAKQTEEQKANLIQSDDNYSNFEEDDDDSEKEDTKKGHLNLPLENVDVSTVKKESEVAKNDDNDDAEQEKQSQGGYTSIGEDNDAVEQEVEKQFQKSLKSASIKSVLEENKLSDRNATSQREIKTQSIDKKDDEDNLNNSQQLINLSLKNSSKHVVSWKGQDSRKVEQTEKSQKSQPQKESEVGKKPDAEEKQPEAEANKINESIQSIAHHGSDVQEGVADHMSSPNLTQNSIAVSIKTSANGKNSDRKSNLQLQNAEAVLLVEGDNQHLQEIIQNQKESKNGSPTVKRDSSPEKIKQIQLSLTQNDKQLSSSPAEQKSIRKLEDKSPKNMQVSSPTVDQIKPEQLDNMVEDNKSQGEQKFSSDDGDATPIKSENLLQFMDTDKKEIEGQSCGRNADSEVSQHPSQDKPVSEEQMLDTAENIIRELAEKLLENEWSVKDVFDHPKLIHFIPSYEGVENVKAISAQNFLGRMYQLSFQEITQLQVACLMRVLGKQDLESAILFDDLTTLMENYNVPVESSGANPKSRGNTSREVPEPEMSPQDKKIGEDNEEAKQTVIDVSHTNMSAMDNPPLQRKQTRRDAISSKVKLSQNPDSAFGKLKEHIASYCTNQEALMDIFKERSYMQNIKSTSRQSETLVIQKNDFFETLTTILSNNGATGGAQIQFTTEETNEIEHCIQLTPKIPSMYAVRHVETLFAALLENIEQQTEPSQKTITQEKSASFMENNDGLAPIREEPN